LGDGQESHLHRRHGAPGQPLSSTLTSWSREMAWMME